MTSSLTFAGVVNGILGVINSLIPVLIGLAMVAFFVGLIRYIYHGDSDKAHEDGKQLITWGLVALFCLVCVWGIVDFIRVAVLGS